MKIPFYLWLFFYFSWQRMKIYAKSITILFSSSSSRSRTFASGCKKPNIFEHKRYQEAWVNSYCFKGIDHTLVYWIQNSTLMRRLKQLIDETRAYHQKMLSISLVSCCYCFKTYHSIRSDLEEKVITST